MVVLTDPRLTGKRQRLEAVIRVLDLIAYAFVFGAGLSAIVTTPPSVVEGLQGWYWIIPLWNGTLVIGGLFGFLGRLIRVWIVEVPGTGLSIVGVGIYFINLFANALGDWGAWPGTFGLGIVVIFLLRRYIELQILTSEPNDRHSLLAWLKSIARRRTDNAVPRQD